MLSRGAQCTHAATPLPPRPSRGLLLPYRLVCALAHLEVGENQEVHQRVRHEVHNNDASQGSFAEEPLRSSAKGFHRPEPPRTTARAPSTHRDCNGTRAAVLISRPHSTHPTAPQASKVSYLDIRVGLNREVPQIPRIVWAGTGAQSAARDGVPFRCEHGLHHEERRRQVPPREVALPHANVFPLPHLRCVQACAPQNAPQDLRTKRFWDSSHAARLESCTITPRHERASDGSRACFPPTLACADRIDRVVTCVIL
jgi:hypothetical protein